MFLICQEKRKALETSHKVTDKEKDPSLGPVSPEMQALSSRRGWECEMEKQHNNACRK